MGSRLEDPASGERAVVLAGTNPMLLATLAVALGAVGVLMFRSRPQLSVVVWMMVVCFVPYWLGLSLQVYAPPTTIIAALLVMSLVNRGHPTFTLIDSLMALIVIITVCAIVAGLASLSSGVVLLAHWTLGYMLGRLITVRVEIAWIYRTIAVVMTAVAILAVLEFVTGMNFFVLAKSNNGLFTTWGGLRYRGGFLRAEGAFGSSIALGASLAIGIPLTLASNFRPWVRIGCVFLMLGATVVSFSRTGMICALLAIVISVVLLRDAISARARTTVLVLTTAVIVVVGPFVLATFTDAGDEASGSAGYRGDLLSLVPTMRAIGLAESATRNAAGELSYGTFQSIDSALIYLGLTHGLIPLGIALLMLASAVVYVVRGRATPATVAIVAQIPALATVALITQYAILFWFIVGIAVSTQLRQRHTRDDLIDDAPPAHPSPYNRELATASSAAHSPSPDGALDTRRTP